MTARPVPWTPATAVEGPLRAAASVDTAEDYIGDGDTIGTNLYAGNDHAGHEPLPGLHVPAGPTRQLDAATAADLDQDSAHLGGIQARAAKVDNAGSPS